MSSAEGPRIVICGAGIAGAATAWQLAAEHGLGAITIVEEGAPLSLTSDKSTECYRNWWPGPDPAMTALTNRSIDLLERLATESANRFALNRRGYLFATACEETGDALEARAHESAALGAGAARVHRAGCDPAGYRPAIAEGYDDALDGADVIRDPELLRQRFPWLSPRAVAVLHARRCGWLSAQQLGMLMLERAREAGARLVRGRLAAVDSTGGRVRAVRVDSAGASERIEADVLVNAAGPYALAVARLAGLELPVACEGHVKMSFEDRLGAVPRDAPLLLWCDPVELPFSPEERTALASTPEGDALLQPFPAGVHGRPEGAGRQVLLYWTYTREALETPVFPLEWDPRYPEICLRGMSVMIPALEAYAEQLPRPWVDGGYYAKTPDNRPLVGALELPGAYAMTAFSGYGIMASPAAAELLAALVTGSHTPSWSAACDPARFEAPGALDAAGSDGQL